MKKTAGILAVLIVGTMSLHAAVTVPEGYTVKALGVNFGGGFDYLPNGDLIGMNMDITGADNTYLGIIDANGDGVPGSVQIVYDFHAPMIFGTFVKVSPDGTFAIFAESNTYKVRRIDLANYFVTEIIPTGGSFDGAYDLAFIDNAHCYISGNPAWGTTNKIWHLDLNGNRLTEVASVDHTYSGGIDADQEGNLYYLRNTDVWPLPDAGAFTLFEFSQASLAAALNGSSVLSVNEAEELAVLDGGYDCAWHSSGTIFISDNHHGKIYTISPEGEFATLSSDIKGGFSLLAFYKRDQEFRFGYYNKQCKLAVGYADEFNGTTPAEIYQIEPVVPDMLVAARSTRLTESGQQKLRVLVGMIAQPTAETFDVYIAIISPFGKVFSRTPLGIIPGVAAYAKGVPGLAEGYRGDLVDVAADSSFNGTWTIHAGLVRTGTPPAIGNAFAYDSEEIVINLP